MCIDHVINKTLFHITLSASSAVDLNLFINETYKNVESRGKTRKIKISRENKVISSWGKEESQIAQFGHLHHEIIRQQKELVNQSDEECHESSCLIFLVFFSG